MGLRKLCNIYNVSNNRIFSQGESWEIFRRPTGCSLVFHIAVKHDMFAKPVWYPDSIHWWMNGNKSLSKLCPDFCFPFTVFHRMIHTLARKSGTANSFNKAFGKFTTFWKVHKIEFRYMRGGKIWKTEEVKPSIIISERNFALTMARKQIHFVTIPVFIWK